MARPNKDDTTKRRIMLRLRITESEKKALQKASENAGFSISDYIRNKSIGTPPVHRKATPERAALIKGLAGLGKIGSNINQMAKVMNRLQNEAMPLPNNIIEEALLQIESLSNHLTKILSHGD
jgi:Bacterial mobilisation protein (MobC)